MKKINKKLIPAQTLKGFRDFYGPDLALRQYVIKVFKQTFEKYGYEPLETPALEYAETLLGKGGGEMDQLAYLFKDSGNRAIGLKYDLTVPSCRFVAQNYNRLIFPFKRYIIQPVWRAEKPQKGRFREFVQCDADVWGSSSPLVEAEFIQMGIEILQKLGFKDFVTRINNRKILNAILSYSQASSKDYYNIATSIDKLEKIGPQGVERELGNRKISPQVSQKILSLISSLSTSTKPLEVLSKTLVNFPQALEGISELRAIFSYLKDLSVPSRFYRYDPSIIRGLSYYTGPVWEFAVTEGQVGSVGGCGRYDQLIGSYTKKDIPAAGGSFGIERLIEVMKDRKMGPPTKNSSLVLVTIFSPDLQKPASLLAQKLRESGISTQLYLDPQAKLQKQLKYADQKQIPYVAIIGPDELKSKKIRLKDMERQSQQSLSQKELIKKLSG
jgi:histidyl-tRNA synthetase